MRREKESDWFDMVKANSYPRRRSPRPMSVAEDFPTYQCTSCGKPLRDATEAYELGPRRIKEKHRWVCEECVYGKLGLLW